MMKINDKELLNQVWLNQLRLLPRGVVHNYFGGSFGLVDDNDFWFSSASSEHVCSILNVTKILSRQQLRKRILKLKDMEKLEFPWGRFLTFYINNDDARKAFKFAREFWKQNGIPEGMKDGKRNTAEIENINSLTNEITKLLINEFGIQPETSLKVAA